MGIPPVGSVVLVPFPYADLRSYKKRPALVVAHAEFDNVIVCQITSKPLSSKKAIELKTSDFTDGGIRLTSYIRPDKLSTLDPKLIQATLGRLSAQKQKAVGTALQVLFSS